MKRTKRTDKSEALFIAMGHPIRRGILTEMDTHEEDGTHHGHLSPSDLSKLLAKGVSRVSYHIKILREVDAIHMVKTLPRRGAIEHYYMRRPWLVKAQQGVQELLADIEQ